MSYAGIYRTYASLNDFRDLVFSTLTSTGWTLHDTIDANTRVYSSKGENGTYAPMYLKVLASGSSLTFSLWAYWNKSTHTGSIQSSTYTSTSTNYGTNFLGISKDFIYLSDTSLTTISFHGFVEQVFHSVITNTNGSIVAGSSVSIPVVSSSGFKVGNNYQIHGVNYEGRDRLTVESIPDSGHIVVATLPRNYASGAFFGQVPFPAFSTGSVSTLYTISNYDSVGTTQGSWYFSPISMSYGMGPDPIADDWTLGPFYVAHTSYGSLGFYNNGYLTIGSSAATAKDTVGVSSNKLEQGAASSGGTNTLTDSSKSWTTNEFANKFVLIISGTGLGQSRKVTSNTSTILTVQDNWTVNPAGDSIYRIADNFYRYTTSGYWVKVTEDLA